MHLDTPATENVEQHATKLTKRHLVNPFWVLIVPFLFPSILAAEPSLAETIEYIEAKLNNEAVDTMYDYTIFRLNGRTVNYITQVGKHLSGDRYEYTFQLSDLSTTVETEQETSLLWNPLSVLRVRATCARGTCVSKSVGGRNSSTTTRQGEIILRVSPGDAERVQKALTHAIKLSGGKDELF